MQYVRSISGSVSKTWNSINPATLSGAIDVVVVEREDGILASSPFHVRFGKFQLLRPSDKKVEFVVNDVKRDFPMKLGEGGEAFFVFETSDHIPHDMQTSPLVSPETSPLSGPSGASNDTLQEVEPLDLLDAEAQNNPEFFGASIERPKSVDGTADTHVEGHIDALRRPHVGQWQSASGFVDDTSLEPADSSHTKPRTFDRAISQPPGELFESVSKDKEVEEAKAASSSEAFARAVHLSKRLWSSNIPTQMAPNGDLMLDMTGYKSDEEQALKAEAAARKVLSEDADGNVDIGALMGMDANGNIWIYSSEEAKMAADRKNGLGALNPLAMHSSDALSDPGYHSDDGQSASDSEGETAEKFRRDSDSAVGMSSPGSMGDRVDGGQSRRRTRNFAKTLRLTHDQLKSLDLKPGQNTMSFTVNKATCSASIYYWQHDVPIVISDIDGTITKSDALGHVLNMIGRDWTHLGVAKLYTDIVANGYHILYLTSRSVGQADTTRGYLNGVVQEGYRLPKGPVILSPDRTMAALRREVYLRKPEVFKMACLRDIMNLFQPVPESADLSNLYSSQRTPFYAGFGNRLTDALSYRSVSIPPTRIFTINSNAEVNLHLLTLNSYRTSYLSIWELVDHFFPPVGLLVKEGGEDYTDFNYWRDRPLDIHEFSDSESEADDDDDIGTEYAGTENEDMEGSFMSEVRESMEESMRESAMLDTVDEGDEHDEQYDDTLHLQDSYIEEHADEYHDDEDAGDDDDSVLVEESRRLQALDLAAEEEEGEDAGLSDLHRSRTSPDRLPKARPRMLDGAAVEEDGPEHGLNESEDASGEYLPASG